MLTEGKVEMFGRGGHPKMGFSGTVRNPFIICESLYTLARVLVRASLTHRPMNFRMRGILSI
jgi:hypothetical protein